MYAEYSTGGWKTSLDLPIIEWPKQTDTYYYSGGPECIPCGGFGGYRIRRVYIHMPDGSRHELRQDDLPRRESIVKTGAFYAVDGSRLRYDGGGEDGNHNSIGTLYLPDGSRYILNGTTAQFIDRNGNTLNYDASTRQWTDTLGRVVGIPLPAKPENLALNSDGTRTFTYTAKGVDGADRTYTLVWKNLANVLTPDPVANPSPTPVVAGTEYLPYPDQAPNTTNNQPVFQSQALFTDAAPDDGGISTVVIGEVGKWAGQGQVFNPVVLAEVRLPDGLSYKFSYNVYGEIDKVIYPTGAYETYQYQELPSIGDNSEPYTQANRGVTKRQLSAKGDGTDLATWTYASTGTVVTMTAPDGTATESYRHSFAAPQHGNSFFWAFGFEDARDGMVYDERVKASATGPILRRTLTQWEQTSASVLPRAGAPASGNNTEQAFRNARPSKEVSIILDTGGNALAKTVTHSYDATYQMTTGLDRIASTEFYFVDVTDPTTVQTGGITVTGSNSTVTISAGTAARSSLTCYLTKPTDICSITSATVSVYDYVGNNILGLPAVSVIEDGNGNVLAKTETAYDETGYAPIYYSGYSAADYTDPGQNAPRGMVTTVKRYVDIGASIKLETHAQYDQFGSLRIATNERGQQVLTDYSSTYKYAYTTQVTTPAPSDPNDQHGSSAGLTSSSTYDSTTGLVLTTTDANGRQTTFSYYDEQNHPDPLNRLRKVTRPDGGWTKYTYNETDEDNDQKIDFYVLTETLQDSLTPQRVLSTYQYSDNMGRASRSLLKESSTSYVVTDTKYDQMGRVCKASNPYRVEARSNISTTGDCAAAASWTTTTYDALGRARVVTLPDATTVQTDYTGIYTTVTDQAGKQRRQKVDALGRIVRVDEPDSSASLGTSVDSPSQPTYYDYDALGNLIHIQQGPDPGDSNNTVQNRYFKYDGLSRLIYERQVEQAAPFSATDATGNSQWSRKLVYDEGSYQGLLTSQYDARQIHTKYDYDNLNRITSISYPNDAATPSVSYFYDLVRFTNSQDTRTIYNLGRLVEVQTAAVDQPSGIGTLPSTSQAYNYDLMGRVANNRQTVGTNSYSMIYQYNLGGALKSEQYPSNRVVSYDYDSAARLSGLSSGNTSYASQFKYDDPRGLLSSFLLGDANNQVKESYSYNSRLQLQSIELAKGSSVLQRYDYKYGKYDQSGTLDETKNNGQIGRIDGTIGTTRQWQQQFEYDSLGRLRKAGEYQGNSTTLTYRMNYAYDVFGNRYQRSAGNPTDHSDGQTNPLPYVSVEDSQIDKATNRFTTGVQYDDAGNIRTDSRFTGRQYLYDANNRQRQVSLLDGTAAVKSVYDADGNRVAVMTGNSVDNVLVYDAGGKLVAEYGQATANNGRSYVFTDHQGSTRVVMDSSGSIKSRHDYQPFGADIPAIGMRSTDAVYGQRDSARQKYAGMETDDGSSNSHTLWRKYDTQSGRWTTTDPYSGSMTIAEPQSFNRYSYVENDPVNQVDPTGLMLSDVGVYQTDDPEEAKIAEHQSLRDLQVSVNADYASRHGGTVSYDGNHASFTSRGRNTQREWLAYAINQAVDRGFNSSGKETALAHPDSGEQWASIPAPPPGSALLVYWPAWSDSVFGHLALYLSSGEYISAYPGRHKGFESPGAGLLGIIADLQYPMDFHSIKDDTAGGNRYYAYELKGLNEVAIMAWFSGLKASNPKWSIQYNCADVVAQAVQAGGLNLKNDIPGYSTPKSVRNLIMETYRKTGINPGVGQQPTWRSNYGKRTITCTKDVCN